MPHHGHREKFYTHRHFVRDNMGSDASKLLARVTQAIVKLEQHYDVTANGNGQHTGGQDGNGNGNGSAHVAVPPRSRRPFAFRRISSDPARRGDAQLINDLADGKLNNLPVIYSAAGAIGRLADLA